MTANEKEALQKARAEWRAIEEKLEASSADYRDATFRKLLDEEDAASKKLERLQAINNAASGLRFGLIFVAVGAGLWLVGYKGWLPEAAEPQFTGVTFGIMGITVAVLNYLSLRANRLKTRRAEGLFNATVTTFGAAAFIFVAAAVPFLWSLLILAVLSIIRHDDFFNLTAFLVVVGGVIVVFMLVVGVAYFCRTKTPEEHAQTFLEYTWSSGMIALYGAMALISVAMLITIADATKEGYVVKSIKEGDTASLVGMALMLAISLGGFVGLVWQIVADIRYLRKPTLENLMRTGPLG